MFTDIQLKNVLNEVAKHAGGLFGDKLVSVVLFGSYARGDYDAESDIDIMILARIDTSEVADFVIELRNRIYRLEIDNDCVISLSVVPESNFEKYKNISPFYSNVSREGIKIAG